MMTSNSTVGCLVRQYPPKFGTRLLEIWLNAEEGAMLSLRTYDVSVS